MKYSDNKYLCRLTATSYNPLATFYYSKKKKTMGIFKTIFNELFATGGLINSIVGELRYACPLIQRIPLSWQRGMLPPRHHSNWRTYGSYCKTGSQ